MAIEILLVAVTVFAATNIDDIFLLAALFGSGQLQRQNIVTGQFAGIGALVAVSSLAAMAALTVPPGWTSLLGVLPLVLGIRALVSLLRGDGDDDDEPTAVQGTVGRSEILAVAGITVANGGDNLGVYIPLFASEPSAIPFYAAVFAAMTALWCLAAYFMVRHPVIKKTVSRYGHILFPVVLIALGLYILSGALVLLG